MTLILKDELERLGANDAPWLGFGTAHLGTNGERTNALRVLDEAFEQGIRYFDTARLYGEGEAEWVIGEAFAKKRDQVILTSKAGIIPWTDRKMLRVSNKLRTTMGLSSIPVEHLFGAFDLRQLKASFDKSLKAMRTDYIDVLLLHECRLEDAENDAVKSWAESLKKAGKIRAFGSAATLAETDRILAAESGHLDVIQHAFDLSMTTDRGAQNDKYQRVTHSALTHVLPMIVGQLDAQPGLAEEAQRDFGVDLTNPGQLIPRLLRHSHQCAPGATVLFSTTKPERIAPVLSVLSQPASDEDGFVAHLKAILANC